MRGVQSVLVAIVGAAALVSCGPPPTPLTGRLVWTHSCDTSMMRPSCAGKGPLVYYGTGGTGSPPLTVQCFVEREANGLTRFRWTIERDSGGNAEGLSACGQLMGDTGVATNVRVSARLFGPSFTSQPDSVCNIRISGSTADSIRGQLRCTAAQDNQMFFRNINGSASPDPNMSTEDPAFADFSFISCVQGSVGNCQ